MLLGSQAEVYGNVLGDRSGAGGWQLSWWLCGVSGHVQLAGVLPLEVRRMRGGHQTWGILWFGFGGASKERGAPSPFHRA